MPPLPTDAFRRIDESPDEDFYATPRLVTHIDDAAIAAVTQLYREVFPPGARVLDLMSSWVSHLPPEMKYAKVVGLGMNAEELAANPRLDERVVQNLNADPRLPFADEAFDAAAICVSIDYLTRPVEVLRELGRVLTVGAPLAITFSNRCFPTKAIAAWHSLDDLGHLRLVAGLVSEAGCFSNVQSLDRTPPSGHDPLFAVVARAASAKSGRRGPCGPRPPTPPDVLSVSGGFF